MKVGLLGGSFDPIHLGHLRAAEVARQELGLDRVIFIPAGNPTHRPALATSARDRYAMVAMAVSTQPVFSVTDLELEREGPSYTVDTLAILNEKHRDDAFFLILGSDAYAEFGNWYEVGRLRKMAALVVVRRPGSDDPAAEGATLLGEAGLPISATAIREMVTRGDSPRFLVPSGVADYIAKRGLYR